MYRKVKRILDFFISFVALIILFIPFVMIGIIIKIESKGPVFFKQERIGKNKTRFFIYKFRSMRSDAPKDMPTHLLNNATSYITKSGNILRKTSLDELPQLINILKGEMSIVGPRPALWNQDDLIEERDKYGANRVTPGLTGWAQVNGRDELEIPIKAKLDGEYAKNISFVQDVKIIFLTVIKIFKREGIVEGKK